MIDHHLGQAEFIGIDNTPHDYKEVFEDVARFGRDPVMQHCKRQERADHLGSGDLHQPGPGELWEEQAHFGYSTGIAMALHMPEGKHFMLGVDRDQPLPTDLRELTRLVADLQLFAVHAQEAAMASFGRPTMPPDLPSLTPRELEALRWTMEGKTAWEVGAILGISERTAVLHVNNAMHKLGCVNKHQAVLKALRLGLIH